MRYGSETASVRLELLLNMPNLPLGLCVLIAGLAAAAPAHAQNTGRFPDPPTEGAPPRQPPPGAAPATPAPPAVPPLERRTAPPPWRPAPAPTTPVTPPPAAPAAPPAPPPPSAWNPAGAGAAPSGSPPWRPEPAASAGGGFYPPVLPYREGQPIPPGYRLEYDANTGLIVGGLVTTLVGYGAALGVGQGSGFKNGTGWLAVPLLGPWAALAGRQNPCAGLDVSDPDIEDLEDAECIEEALDEAQLMAFMTIDGLVQATGAVLFVIGLATGEDQLVRQDIAGFRLVPRVGATGFGLSAHARF